jgi:hypothetical protein
LPIAIVGDLTSHGNLLGGYGGEVEEEDDEEGEMWNVECGMWNENSPASRYFFQLVIFILVIIIPNI